MSKCNCNLNLNKPRPLAYFLPFHYHVVPGIIRKFLASTIIRPNKISNPKDLCSCQIEISERNIWPKNHQIAFALTYDIDTRSGLDKILELKQDPFFSKIKSTVNLVTHSYYFTKEEIEVLKKDGWEIAVHGDNHDSKLVFEDEVKINTRIENSKFKIESVNSMISGIRSPSLLYTEEYFKVVEKHFSYDSSMYFDDGEFSIFKIFPFKIGSLLEIPITLPMDVHFIFLNLSEKEKFEIWIERLKFIRKYRGMAVLVIHPDDHFFTRKSEDTLKQFLNEVKNNDAWLTTCHEIYRHFSHQ